MTHKPSLKATVKDTLGCFLFLFIAVFVWLSPLWFIALAAWIVKLIWGF